MQPWLERKGHKTLKPCLCPKKKKKKMMKKKGNQCKCSRMQPWLERKEA
jgi:hypothetical protein